MRTNTFETLILVGLAAILAMQFGLINFSQGSPRPPGNIAEEASILSRMADEQQNSFNALNSSLVSCQADRQDFNDRLNGLEAVGCVTKPAQDSTFFFVSYMSIFAGGIVGYFIGKNNGKTEGEAAATEKFNKQLEELKTKRRKHNGGKVQGVELQG